MTVRRFYDAFSQQWLAERLRLFRRYCVPGMARQTLGDFVWLILCDETTDREFIEGIQQCASAVPQLRVATTSRSRDVGIPLAVAPAIEAETELLITTRLDGDDSFHVGMIAAVQGYIDPFIRSSNHRLVLDFPRGYQYDEPSRRLYAHHWMNNPFVSMFEKLDPDNRKLGPRKWFRNVYQHHNKLHLRTPVHYDASIPGWIHVIHGKADSSELDATAVTGGNVLSRLHQPEIEVDPAGIESDFAVNLGTSSTAPT
jgi:hypothetical protein